MDRMSHYECRDAWRAPHVVWGPTGEPTWETTGHARTEPEFSVLKPAETQGKGDIVADLIVEVALIVLNVALGTLASD
jgi:hypothetical protein